MYIGGVTDNTLPAISKHQQTLGGMTDGFILKTNNVGQFQWATYYGGGGDDRIRNIIVDGSDNVISVGITNSTGGIAGTNAYQSNLGGNNDMFLTSFSTAGNRNWGTYFGGAEDDESYDAQADISGNIYAVGDTKSSSGISTTGAFQGTLNPGQRDGFIVKFRNTPAGIETLSSRSAKVYPNPATSIVEIQSPEVMSTVDVVNITGQTLISKEINARQAVIDVQLLPSGMYLLKIDNQYSEKFIKQ